MERMAYVLRRSDRWPLPRSRPGALNHPTRSLAPGSPAPQPAAAGRPTPTPPPTPPPPHRAHLDTAPDSALVALQSRGLASCELAFEDPWVEIPDLEGAMAYFTRVSPGPRAWPGLACPGLEGSGTHGTCTSGCR